MKTRVTIRLQGKKKKQFFCLHDGTSDYSNGYLSISFCCPINQSYPLPYTNELKQHTRVLKGIGPHPVDTREVQRTFLPQGNSRQAHWHKVSSAALAPVNERPIPYYTVLKEKLELARTT